MNLSELRGRVRRLTGMRMEALVSDADINQAINESYDHLLSREQWPFCFTEGTVNTVQDASFYDLPVDLRRVYSVHLGDGTRLQPVSPAELEDTTPQTGTPEVYAVTDDNSLWLYPAPDKVLTVKVAGWRRTPVLAARTDEPIFDREYHAVLAYLASIQLLAEEGDTSDRQERFAGQAGELYGAMRKHYLPSHDRGLAVMGGQAAKRQTWSV